MKLEYKGAFKIDLRDRTDEEKYKILQFIKPLAPNYSKGHYFFEEIERIYDLIGNKTCSGFTCFSVSTDKRFKASVYDFDYDGMVYDDISKTEHYEDFMLSFI